MAFVYICKLLTFPSPCHQHTFSTEVVAHLVGQLVARSYVYITRERAVDLEVKVQLSKIVRRSEVRGMNPWSSSDLLSGIELGSPQGGLVLARRFGLLSDQEDTQVLA